MTDVPEVDGKALLERLGAESADSKHFALAFDADGTIWTGDVGESVFEYCLRERLLRDEATEELAAMALAHGLGPGSDPNDMGKALLDEHRSGRLPNLPAYEMMTWAYAGWSPAELSELARDVLERTGHRRHGVTEIEPVLEWGEKRKAIVGIVSASPAIIVRVALELLGLATERVAGGEPRINGDRIQPGMASPLPYGPTKRTRARTLLGDTTLVAAFGDSDYDLDLLVAAKVGVLVRPKPALTRTARGRSSLVRLKRTSTPAL